MQQSQTARGPAVTQLTAAVTLGCVTLVDATGHEHAISVTFCASFQQLNETLRALFKHETIEAQIQRWYMEQGQYDLCIDDDKKVTRLTSDEWPSIEAGTTIVLRVVFEQESYSTVEYKCRLCGAVNHISAKYSLRRQASCSIDCRQCKRRFQISDEAYIAKRGTQSSDIDMVPRTEAEMNLIRNFCIQQNEDDADRREDRRRAARDLAAASQAVNQDARNYNADGASVTAHYHRNEFLDDDSSASSQPSHVSPTHDAEYGSNRFEEVEEDSDDDYDEEDGTEDSDDREDHEEWEDCEGGEDYEETNCYGEL